MDFVMSSPRIKFLEATRQEILDAVKDTSEFTIKCEGEVTWFVRKSPLPVLRKRKENKKVDRRRDINGGRGRDPHAIGYVLGFPALFIRCWCVKEASRLSYISPLYTVWFCDFWPCLISRCLLKIAGVPENDTKWQEIKDALREKLPEKVRRC